MASVPTTVAQGLRENGIDSIRHAMDHFSQRRQNDGRSAHDDKWIVLSVHHAAECVCNALLLDIDPTSPLFRRGAADWFPSLTKSLVSLTSAPTNLHLTPAELELLSLLGQLVDHRHKFMHRIIPAQVDVSTAAMCLMGILKHLEARHGTDSSDIVWQSPPIETEVVAAIRYQRLDEYSRFVEAFLREKYTNRELEQCPACGVRSLLGIHCEACFEELSSVTCDACGSEVPYMAWQRGTGAQTVECDCGVQINV